MIFRHSSVLVLLRARRVSKLCNQVFPISSRFSVFFHRNRENFPSPRVSQSLAAMFKFFAFLNVFNALCLDRRRNCAR